MRLFKLAILFFVLILSASCEKILDVSSPNEVGDENVITSAAGLRNARIGMYSTLQSRDYYGGYFPLLAEGYSDNGSTGGYDVIDLNDIRDKALSPNNLYVKNVYYAIYYSIYTANKIIENADKIKGIETEELSNIKGEAYFVKALSEFDLLRLFGEHWNNNSAYGISIANSTKNPTVAIPRSSVKDSYAQIISDLQKSTSLLNLFSGNQYASLSAAKALLAKVYLYSGDKAKAISNATAVINDANFALLGPADFTKMYTQKNTSESIFELVFSAQNPSFYNGLTYGRDDALRTEIQFLASENLKTFFEGRADDPRASLVDFDAVDASIQPDGRTQKYRGEISKENSAYIIRLADVYLIRAEAKGNVAGLEDLNTVRLSRGMAPFTSEEVTNTATYLDILLDERRSELNFESSRLFDLARTNKVDAILGEGVNPIMPIPQSEIAVTNGVVKQNPGY